MSRPSRTLVRSVSGPQSPSRQKIPLLLNTDGPSHAGMCLRRRHAPAGALRAGAPIGSGACPTDDCGAAPRLLCVSTNVRSGHTVERTPPGEQVLISCRAAAGAAQTQVMTEVQTVLGRRSEMKHPPVSLTV